ncbi:MAG: enoyl-CoA hydratase/isomerase family protein [Candidatus Synoicihabitans palmerolidicus]|nr:enoyl-CoA hydratase/isomerase family protein [Candidatus Synoicihabitans palmerolidicus]MCC5025189.1 enoyl-CoA hydratase/isomerase family protein [Candidatus Synoicihabitans palmerolidicus]MCC5025738.1 enoyl-CoA hydratase/isomerase family protein [Candidatus Synoicihabitans palmerolidicus]MCC5025867.1 enoyl-CoA hydratase/isomerase family protein [Candidatus Synoicihabitans palmerolidicus]MCC5025880.1 enoyl-CoA hydratase/isomerase family protein [Candidatus Synoicihabitans palmerolidicus]
MSFETLLVESTALTVSITINRPERANSINATLLRELNAALDEAERISTCRMILLRGGAGVFCTGMDFVEIAGESESQMAAADYMAILKRLASSPKTIVAVVDGKVMAGGVGLVAASDLVLATSRSVFSLSEALWGILPCCVVPFLIRRVGFQQAYAMTMTTRTLSVAEALNHHLVDEVTDELDEALRRLSLRLGRLTDETVVELKSYFQKMWMLTPEMEQTAVTEIGRLLNKPTVREGIANFVNAGRFPWEVSS